MPDSNFCRRTVGFQTPSVSGVRGEMKDATNLADGPTVHQDIQRYGTGSANYIPCVLRNNPGPVCVSVPLTMY